MSRRLRGDTVTPCRAGRGVPRFWMTYRHRDGSFAGAVVVESNALINARMRVGADKGLTFWPATSSTGTARPKCPSICLAACSIKTTCGSSNACSSRKSRRRSRRHGVPNLHLRSEPTVSSMMPGWLLCADACAEHFLVRNSRPVRTGGRCPQSAGALQHRADRHRRGRETG